MSIFTYNGITLPYAHTTNFSMDAIGDELGNTDLLYIKYDIEVESVINTSYLSTICGQDLLTAGQFIPEGLNPAGVMMYIKNKLMQRRKELVFSFNGTDIAPPKMPGVSTNVDARNGPIPQFCKYIQLSNETFLISYRVIAHYYDNLVANIDNDPPVTSRDSSAILSCRWKETLSIDGTNLTTRIREGKYVMRSNNEAKGIADQYRSQFAVLAVPEGCVRRKAEYTVDPSGLGIAFTIVDSEVYKLPPSPALTAKGSYRETCGKGGAMRQGHVKVVMQGDKTENASQERIIRTAVGAAASKLNAVGANLFAPGRGRQGTLLGAAIEIGMYDNIVSVEIQALFPNANFRVEGLAWGRPNWTLTPGSTKNTPVMTAGDAKSNYPLRGTMPSNFNFLQAAAYYDPNLQATVNAATGQLNKGRQVGTEV